MQQPVNSPHHEDFDKTFEEWISPSAWADFKSRYNDGKHAVSEVYARLACIVFHRSILQKEDVDCCGEEFQLKSSACFRFARRYPSSGTSSSLVLYADCLKEFDRLKTLVDEKWSGLSCRTKVPLDLYMDELWALQIDREPPQTAAAANGGGLHWDPLSTAITCRQDAPILQHSVTSVSGQPMTSKPAALPCQEVPTRPTPTSDEHLEEKKPSPVRRQQQPVTNRPIPTLLQRPDFDTPVSAPERYIPGGSSLVPHVYGRLEQPISGQGQSEPNHPATFANESESKPDRSSGSGNDVPVLRQSSFGKEDSPSKRAAAPLPGHFDMAPIRKAARTSSSSRDPLVLPESAPTMEPRPNPPHLNEKKSNMVPAGKSSPAVPSPTATNSSTTLRRSSRKRTINQYYGHDESTTRTVERRAQDPAASQINPPDTLSEHPNHLDEISADLVRHQAASTELDCADEPSKSSIRQEPGDFPNRPHAQPENAESAAPSTSQLHRAFRPTRRVSFAKANAGLLDDWIQAEEENSLVCEDDDDLDELVEVDEDLEEEQENETDATVSDENSTPSSEKKKRAQYRKGQMTCEWEGCGKVFGSHSAYDRHRLAHLGTRPFKCSFAGCTAAFNYGTTLKRHESSHNGVRPFQCDMCDASFVQKYTLQIHLRTHTGEKPFGCPRCDYRTIHKGHVQRHLRKVHNVTDKNHAIVDERELENSV